MIILKQIDTMTEAFWPNQYGWHGTVWHQPAMAFKPIITIVRSTTAVVGIAQQVTAG
jgi:hypothetical protein